MNDHCGSQCAQCPGALHCRNGACSSSTPPHTCQVAKHWCCGSCIPEGIDCPTPCP
jgi:hypothetical protein